MGKSQTYKKKRGGKYLGEGTYGCAFSPALYCKTNGPYRKSHTLSKLMVKDYAEEEYAVANVLKPVDPDQQFFLYPTGLCKPDFKRFEPAENNLNSCTIYEKKLKKRPFNALIVESRLGGTDLHKVQLNTGQILPFFRDFSQLLEGLSLLHKNSLAHLDIKDLNIVTEETGSGRFDFHFIDFGFLTKIDTFDVDSKTPPIGSSYSIWPYDLRFAQSFWTTENIEEENLEEWKKDANGYFGDILNTNRITQYTEDDYKELFEKLKTMNRADMLKIILTGADVYSLGLTLGLLWARFIGHTEPRGDVTPIVPIKSALGASEAYRKAKVWYGSIAIGISPRIFALVHEMMNPDVTKRITAQRAYEKYNDMLTVMKYYLAREQIGPSLRLSYPDLPSPKPVPPTPHGLEAISTNLFTNGGKRQNKKSKTRKSRKER